RRASVPAPRYPAALPVSDRKGEIAAAIAAYPVVIVAGETGSGKSTQLPKICLEVGRGVRGMIGHTQPRRLAARALAERVAEELGSEVGGAVGYAVRFTDRVRRQTLVKVMTAGLLLNEVQRDRLLTDYDTTIVDAAGADERAQVQGITDAVAELTAGGPGDVLVFLSGERESRDTAEALAALALPDTELLPLYARLSAADQHRVFAPHPGRRIVLATNVAETSLTVPGIRYVIDPGTARISRYSHRTKVQRLPIEPVSQASANQRKGRCGRTADGICVRLYSQEDFEARPEFTDPEILRTNLASVILQMTSLGLGDIAAFPFVEPPDRRQVADGIGLLQELGAFDTSDAQRLTDVGRKLAQLPVDPRMARMVLEAASNGCVREVMIIAAALS